LSFGVQTHGARRVVPSTLVVGVLADLSGQPDPALPPLAGRAFVEIDRDNFDEVCAKFRPRLACRVPNLMRGDGSQLDVVLSFARLDDFEPEQVVRQVEPMGRLIGIRRRLANLAKGDSRSEQVASVLQELRNEIGVKEAPASGPRRPETASDAATIAEQAPAVRPVRDEARGNAGLLEDILGLAAGSLPPAREESHTPSESLLADFLDRAMAGVGTVSKDTLAMISDGVARIDAVLSKQLSHILQHASFQDLESAWRGLHQLVFDSDTSESLKIRVLDVKKSELLQEIAQGGALDQTALFRKLDKAAEHGEPFGVILGDFQFSNDSADLALLEVIAQTAAAAHAPFLAAAAPAFFGVSDFNELDQLPGLSQRLESTGYSRWLELRASDASGFAGLCVPSILCRLPYGRETRSVELFDFEEDFRGSGPRAYLWGNPVFALGRCLTRAFAEDGSCEHIQGMETGGKVARLSVHIARIDGEPVVTGPCAVALSHRRAAELAGLGFIPLVSIRNTDEAVFLTVPSCHRPESRIRIEVGHA
jgi:type VI secretion system protein ImpC